MCPLFEKCGTFIARCNALIEKVSSFRPLLAELKKLGLEFQPVVSLDDPDDAAAHPLLYTEAFAKVAKANSWTGWNL
eukprot:SAG31_NODE_21203_length_555_cov_1.021930_1_plen_76_part_10